jgi:hypothetical protein
MRSPRRRAPEDLPASSAAPRNLAAPQKTSPGPKGSPDRPTVSEPLRQEAERRWAESDQAAVKRTRRTKARVQAHSERRQAARDKDEEIGRLRAELDRARRGRTR